MKVNVKALLDIVVNELLMLRADNYITEKSEMMTLDDAAYTVVVSISCLFVSRTRNTACNSIRFCASIN